MPPLTTAEASHYRATSTHAEVMRYIEALADLGDPRLRVASIGTTPGGREIPLLILSARGLADAEAAKALGKPIVLLQNCIHAGEVEGKEAALALARDLLSGPDQDLLDGLTLLVLPVFNPDGNDAMDTANRALHIDRLSGQDGPPKVGTRNNAAGINLNRDYIRHDSAEMRFLQVRVAQEWTPDLTVDSHATNGSVHRFAMTHDIPHPVESGRAEPIAYMREVLVPDVASRVKAHAGLDSGWYGNFVEDERALDAEVLADPLAPVREGWMTYPHHPRFGSNYRGLGGRLDLLLECYSYLPFDERIRTTYAWQLEVLRAVAARGGEIRSLLDRCLAPPARVAVQYEIRDMPSPVEILTRQPRTRTGAPARVTLPHRARFVGTRVVDRPRAYLVPGRLAPFLRGHGLRLEAAPSAAEVEIATFEGVAKVGGRKILEAAGTGARRVAWSQRTIAVDPGAVLLPTDQPLGALAVYLCEPESDDGLVENGMVGTPAAGGEFEVGRVIV
jgi:hypothetical protein